MRIFVAGATGALGRRWSAAGRGRAPGDRHDPLAGEGGAGCGRLGAEPVVADALDRDAVRAASRAARPEVVVHELTALAGR